MSQFDRTTSARRLLSWTCSGSACSRRCPTPSRVRVDGPAAATPAPTCRTRHPSRQRRIDLTPSRWTTDDLPVRSTHTLGCFQIESPGQRELVGRFAPETFNDLIIDISLFRPGPVKSDMVTPFLRARQGWDEPQYLHPTLRRVLEETSGVVVFHEQVLELVSISTGCTLAEADEIRRAMGSVDGQREVEDWWRPRARAAATTRRPAGGSGGGAQEAFASFGFCKAHAAAFAMPTYQSAWLKAPLPLRSPGCSPMTPACIPSG
jgi:hypothetical protein